MRRTIDMLRPNLDDLPPLSIAEGCRLVTAAELDDPLPMWADLLNISFEQTDWSPARLKEQFVGQPQYDPEGVFFVMDGDRGLSTAFAWRDTPQETHLGRVHFVGALPQERGRGLGRAVVVAIMHYFADRGFEQVFLGTQGYRKPAVQLYLSLGFKPWPHDDEEERIWAEWLEKHKSE